MADKVIPPMMIPAIKVEASKFCPFRTYGSIDYKESVSFENERTIPDTCPLEDWDKYNEQIDKEMKQHQEASE